MDSMANTFSVCQVMVSLRVKKHLSASALVMGVVMGILNRERECLKRHPWDYFPWRAATGFELLPCCIGLAFSVQLSVSSGNAFWLYSKLEPCSKVALTRWFMENKLSWMFPNVVSQPYREKNNVLVSLPRTTGWAEDAQRTESWATHLISSMKLWTTCGVF